MGPLPWIAEAAAEHHFALEEHDGHPAHRHADASDIPGSPTHPVDHDCFQCQVLKHLARCVSTPPEAPQVDAPAGGAVQPLLRVDAPLAVPAVALPPARAPPLRQI